jgi:putative endonuclease
MIATPSSFENLENHVILSGMTSSLSLGRLGEAYAAAHLKQLGYQLVASNFTVPVGRNLKGAVINVEIDLIAYDGACLCFVEVKTRSYDTFLPPQVNVDLRKRRQISRGAKAYRHMLALEGEPYRYDVVTVVLDEGPPKIDLLRDFWQDQPRRSRANFYYDQ